VFTNTCSTNPAKSGRTQLSLVCTVANSGIRVSDNSNATYNKATDNNDNATATCNNGDNATATNEITVTEMAVDDNYWKSERITHHDPVDCYCRIITCTVIKNKMCQ